MGVFILLGVYWASRIFSLVPVINFRKCSVIITSNISLFLSLFFLLLVFLLIYFVHFVVILWILDISFNFFHSFFFCILVIDVSIDISSSSLILFSIIPSLLMSLSNFCYTVFLFLPFLLIFLEFSSLCLLHDACSLVLFTYSVRALSLY